MTTLYLILPFPSSLHSIFHCTSLYYSDNTLLGGRTIDYGPFGWMEKYDPFYQVRIVNENDLCIECNCLYNYQFLIFLLFSSHFDTHIFFAPSHFFSTYFSPAYFPPSHFSSSLPQPFTSDSDGKFAFIRQPTAMSVNVAVLGKQYYC